MSVTCSCALGPELHLSTLNPRPALQWPLHQSGVVCGQGLWGQYNDKKVCLKLHYQSQAGLRFAFYTVDVSECGYA